MSEIRTKYEGPTDRHGSRIVARFGSKQLTTPYEHADNASANHARAAAMLASKLKLSGHWVEDDFGRTGFGYKRSETGRDAFRVGTASSAIPYSYTLLGA